MTATASAHGQAHRDQRKPRAPPHPVGHVIVPRMPLTDVERTRLRGDRDARRRPRLACDDADRVRHDGPQRRRPAARRSRAAGVPRRAAAGVGRDHRPLGARRRRDGRQAAGAAWTGLRRPPAADRHASGRGRRPVAAVQRPHRRRVRRAPRRLDERPVRRAGPRRQALRTRRVRHEGRDRGDGVRRPRSSRSSGSAGRRPARGHQHRRGVLRRGRHRARRARPHGRRRDRHRADRLRGLGRVPRIGVRRDHRSRATRPRRGQPARLARGRRGQRDREGRGRARGDRLAAARVVAAGRLRPSVAVTAVAAADDGAQRRVAGHLPGLVRAHDRGDVPAGAGRLQRLGDRRQARGRGVDRARDRARRVAGRAPAGDRVVAERRDAVRDQPRRADRRRPCSTPAPTSAALGN